MNESGATQMYYCTLSTPIGELLLAGTPDALHHVHFQSGPHPMRPDKHWEQSEKPFRETIRQLKAYFAGKLTHFDLPRISPAVDIDASHKLFAIDHNRCILCLRCVRVCDEIEGAHTWDVMHRGLETRVQTDMGIPWGESPTCTSCGKCVQVCPTGALFEKGRPVAAGSKTKRPFLPWLRVHQEERGL